MSGTFYRLTYNFIEFFEHMGTHFDAPGHFMPGKQQMHEIPAQQLIGPGVIIDVKSQAAGNSTYGVTVGDIQNYERKYGRIPSGAIVIMNSGWGYKYPDKFKVFGTQDLSSMANFRFPGWTVEAAEIVMKRKLSFNIINPFLLARSPYTSDLLPCRNMEEPLSEILKQ